VTKKDNLEQISNLKDIYIDSEIPECFYSSSTDSTKKQVCKISDSDTIRTQKRITQFLENIKTEIETKPQNPYNIDWYKIAALKEVVLSERAGNKSFPEEIKEKTIELLDAAITLVNRIDK